MSENSEDAGFVVGKDFLTASSRFRVGDTVRQIDIPSDHPMSWADLRKRGFVIGAETKAAKKAEEKADERTKAEIEAGRPLEEDEIATAASKRR